ncbi:FAD-dependent monooxygenase [Thermomonospora amylolytica]|uniref:FAD-dependent monooxygenase n=1 Tax=Thermomonospora amylolytica TaxID=1411117 RepID=UPI001F1FE1B2|nr:FAD-dependent monooxygenase [Thermomonospora amylolytica]
MTGATLSGVGGGTTGCAPAILLAWGGVQVEIAEIRPDWNVQGSGITLQGNALKVLRELGVWDEVRASGFGFDGVGIRTPDGTLVHRAEDMRTGGPDEVTRTDLIYGGPCRIAGYCPISDEQLYAYLVEDARPRESVDPGGDPVEIPPARPRPRP